MARLTAILVLALAASPVRAGLYYSGESFAELPSKWSGFLVDHRSLRVAGIEKPKDAPQTPLREAYLAAAAKLKDRAKTADELADLGALDLRLGKVDAALEVLRKASRQFPDHFHIAANLGTAWQMSGDLEQAAASLEEAVRLAPTKLKPFEDAHLKLVRLRLKEGKTKPEAVDDLFGAKPPENAAALVQFLALALPADGRLLWQLGEIAKQHGDVRIAAAILDGCVSEFAMGAKLLREHRAEYRALAEKHEDHKSTFVPKSARPLLRQFDASTLPPIRDDSPNPLPWALVAGTTVEKGVPSFPEHLRKLDGKPVVLFGFVQPVGDATEFRGFLFLEYPVGCWFCENPDPTAIVNVELAAGLKATPRRALAKLTGTLRLNRDNPEDYLLRIENAKLADPE
jgi:tetratricopeptide (TPR) repeat protein